MWPLLKRDGLGVQYITLVFLWNYIIGHNPSRQSALKYLTTVRLLVYIMFFVIVVNPTLPVDIHRDRFATRSGTGLHTPISISRSLSCSQHVTMRWCIRSRLLMESHTSSRAEMGHGLSPKTQR